MGFHFHEHGLPQKRITGGRVWFEAHQSSSSDFWERDQTNLIDQNVLIINRVTEPETLPRGNRLMDISCFTVSIINAMFSTLVGLWSSHWLVDMQQPRAERLLLSDYKMHWLFIRNTLMRAPPNKQWLSFFCSGGFCGSARNPEFFVTWVL